jgi:hypothetical protein
MVCIKENLLVNIKKRIYKSNKYLKIGEKYIAMLFLPKNILKL